MCIRLSFVVSLFVATSAVCKAQENTLDQTLNGNADFPQYVVKETDDEITKFRKQQINAAIVAFDATRGQIQTGTASIMDLGPIQEKLLDAQMKFHKNKAEKTAALERALQLAKQIEEQQKKRYLMGAVKFSSAAMASYFRLDVQIRLAELKAAK